MNLIFTTTRASLMTKTASLLLFIRLVGPSLTFFDPSKYVDSWLLRGRHSAVNSQSRKRNPDDLSDENMRRLWKLLPIHKVSIMERITDQVGVIDKHSLNGKHECQWSERGEGDLHKYLVGCEKNPGHAQFIPVKAFKIQHLPNGHRNNDLYECIKAAADLTVRVDVKMTSPQRPQFWPGTDNPYPFYDFRKRKNLRYGSGKINIFKVIDGCGFDESESRYNELFGAKYDTHYKTCPCAKCQHSDKPNNVWWEIIIFTATHVVFDDTEASQTICRLFIGEQDSEEIIFDELRIIYVNIDKDQCALVYKTCDTRLGEKLYTMAALFNSLWKKVCGSYVAKSNDKLSFIVSHPHGCAKQISVGHWVEHFEFCQVNAGFSKTKVTYTTSTCPGSSGARVFCVGSPGSHIHSGALTVSPGLNYSSVGLYLI